MGNSYIDWRDGPRIVPDQWPKQKTIGIPAEPMRRRIRQFSLGVKSSERPDYGKLVLESLAMHVAGGDRPSGLAHARGPG